MEGEVVALFLFPSSPDYGRRGIKGDEGAPTKTKISFSRQTCCAQPPPQMTKTPLCDIVLKAPSLGGRFSW